MPQLILRHYFYISPRFFCPEKDNWIQFFFKQQKNVSKNLRFHVSNMISL